MSIAIAASRIFNDTELVIDMFGPIIDISQIDIFAGTNPRFKTEEEIADLLKWLHPSGAENIDDKFILEMTKKTLSSPRPARRLIDEQMCRLVCQAARQGYTIRIVSSAPVKAVFDAGQKVITEYVASLHSTSGLTKENFEYCPLDEPKNGKPPQDRTRGIRKYLLGRAPAMKDNYTIVVDDSPPFRLDDKEPELHQGVHYDDWLSGTDTEPQVIYRRLSALLEDRKRVKDASLAVREICTGNSNKSPLQLRKSYGAVEDFCVFHESDRTWLSSQVESIKEVITTETNGPPICVFLGGPPGSGKSFFVKQCTIQLKAPSNYPVTSLSGVGTERFSDAIEHHIDMVYGKATSDDLKIPMVALLDEVDTVTSAGESAFRLLMDAMTGSRTDKYGLNMKEYKNGSVQRLVWFFAGSGGRRREDFVRRFQKRDRKVNDFFDRIHFYLTLPGVEVAGQAIVQGLNTLTHADIPTPLQAIEKNVLLFLGASRWTSARQVNTICRLAATKGGKTLRLSEIADLVKGTQELSEMYIAVKEKNLFGDELLYLPPVK